jgi:hypothetical protein
LGLITIRKLGGPNYKKLLPVVILIASERAGGLLVATPSQASIGPPLGEGRDLAPSDLSARLVQPVSSASVPPTPSLVPEPLPEPQAEQLDFPPQPVVGPQEAVQPSTSYPDVWLSRRKPPAKPTSRSTVRSVQSATPTPRTISKAEKRNFCLRPENRLLCEITAEDAPGFHYLDLPSDSQEIIQGLAKLRTEAKAEETRATEESMKASEAPQTERCDRALENAAQKQREALHASGLRRRKSYEKLLPNLTFDPAALEQLERLASTANCSQVEEKLGFINLGHAKPDDTINGTEPKILNFHAGYDYRIYAHRQGAKTYIKRVGDKGTQSADIKRLRNM